MVLGSDCDDCFYPMGYLTPMIYIYVYILNISYTEAKQFGMWSGMHNVIYFIKPSGISVYIPFVTQNKIHSAQFIS